MGVVVAVVVVILIIEIVINIIGTCMVVGLRQKRYSKTMAEVVDPLMESSDMYTRMKKEIGI